MVESLGEPLVTIEQKVSDDENNLPLCFLQQNAKQKIAAQKNIV